MTIATLVDEPRTKRIEAWQLDSRQSVTLVREIKRVEGWSKLKATMQTRFVVCEYKTSKGEVLRATFESWGFDFDPPQRLRRADLLDLTRRIHWHQPVIGV